jgi:hypothetical protein
VDDTGQKIFVSFILSFIEMISPETVSSLKTVFARSEGHMGPDKAEMG